jgi:hypothetical protein
MNNGYEATRDEVVEMVCTTFKQRPIIVFTNQSHVPACLKKLGRIVVIDPSTNRILFRTDESNQGAINKLKRGGEGLIKGFNSEPLPRQFREQLKEGIKSQLSCAANLLDWSFIWLNGRSQTREACHIKDIAGSL